MKFEAINKRFTEVAAEWLAKGYYINTATMGGSQGELGRLDLTNGTEIIRIFVGHFTERDQHFYEGVELVAGRVPSRVEPNRDRDDSTIWNNELEVITRERFYLVGETRYDRWYGTKEEACRAIEISYARYRARSNCSSWMLGAKAGKIVLNRVRKQRGCSRAKASEIKVEKRVYESRVHYIAHYGDKAIQLA